MFILGSFTEEDVREYDLFNANNTREDWELAGETSEYNCMAYAFGAFEWMVPYSCWSEDKDIKEIAKEINLKKKKHIETLAQALYYGDYDHPFAMKLAVTRMLKRFKGLRRIKSLKELQRGECGIAYACGGGDFHFGTYIDGSWSHKMGSLDAEDVECEDDVFGDRYDSRRVYFAMKFSEIGKINFD